MRIETNYHEQLLDKAFERWAAEQRRLVLRAKLLRAGQALAMVTVLLMIVGIIVLVARGIRP